MLHLNLNQGDGVPLYLQIVRQIKHLIATGRLDPDTELPPVRQLSQQLVINPNTVVRAYRELETAGLIYKRRGAGTYVSDRGSPYADAERRRMLMERADALLIEGRGLGYEFEEVIEILRERDQQLSREISGREPEV